MLYYAIKSIVYLFVLSACVIYEQVSIKLAIGVAALFIVAAIQLELERHKPKH